MKKLQNRLAYECLSGAAKFVAWSAGRLIALANPLLARAAWLAKQAKRFKDLISIGLVYIAMGWMVALACFLLGGLPLAPPVAAAVVIRSTWSAAS